MSKQRIFSWKLYSEPLNDEGDFLYEEYEKMRSAYPKESYSDFPLLALHIINDTQTWNS